MMAPDDAPPVQCQRRGCHKHAHHVCANKWLEANNFADKTVSLTLCREHHPQYYLMNVLLKPPPTIPPPLDNEATATAASAKPHTSATPAKKSKYFEWSEELRDLSLKEKVILDYRDPSGNIPYRENCYLQCLFCRDGKGKSDGIIYLRYPFNVKLWEQHASGKRHKENVEWRNFNISEESPEKEGDVSRPADEGDKHPFLANAASILMEDEEVATTTMPPTKKSRSKYTEWSEELRELSQKGLVILNYRDPYGKVPHVENGFIQCVYCRDGMGKSDGVINLRKPFNVPLWEQHTSGQRHRVNVQRHDTIVEMRKEKGAFVPTLKTNNNNRVHENTAGSTQSPPNLSSPPLGETAKDSSGINLPPAIPRENSKLHADCCGLFNCVRVSISRSYLQFIRL